MIYVDDTWAFVQFSNVKLAFVIKSQHPPHIAFQVDDFEEGDRVKSHRDGTHSVYKRDPFGNIYELIKYPKNKLISVIGAVHPAIGGILGTNRLITYYIQATGDINYFIVFHVMVDVIVVSICIYSLVKLRKQKLNIQS